jgi:hypothetical protein
LREVLGTSERIVRGMKVGEILFIKEDDVESIDGQDVIYCGCYFKVLSSDVEDKTLRCVYMGEGES